MQIQHNKADYWINKLKLSSHPEGGYFREMYRSGETIKAEHLPDRFRGDRSFGTAIYYLLRTDELSRLHRIQSDEIWHFYQGLPLLIHQFGPGGIYDVVRLGGNPERGEQFQHVVPAGTWFGVTVDLVDGMEADFALTGCTVAPGFDFEDFEMADKRILQAYPDQHDIINKLL